MIELLTANDLLKLNHIVNNSDGKVINFNSLESCLSSFHYYETLQEQSAAIFRSLLLNHCFLDGNKRTAVILIGALSNYYDELKINISDDELYNLIMWIIENKPTVFVIANKLYSK